MKYNINIRVINLFLLTIIAMGCQKNEYRETELRKESSNSSMGWENSSGCRVSEYIYYDGVSDVYSNSYYSYVNGLLDQYIVPIGWTCKMEYNNKGKLIGSRVYENQVMIYSIEFVYENNKITKEVWYEGDSKNIADEVLLSYNSKGDITRSESFMLDYHCVNTFSENGDLTSWFYFSGGQPIAKGEYQHLKHHKNPLLLTPGLEHDFPFVNSAFNTSKNWYSSEKVTLYDENGNDFVLYEIDPMSAKWEYGPENIPVKVEYSDKNTDAPLSTAFVLENCGQEIGNSSIKSRRPDNASASGSMRSIMGGPRRQIKQKIQEIRKTMVK